MHKCGRKQSLKTIPMLQRWNLLFQISSQSRRKNNLRPLVFSFEVLQARPHLRKLNMLFWGAAEQMTPTLPLQIHSGIGQISMFQKTKVSHLLCSHICCFLSVIHFHSMLYFSHCIAKATKQKPCMCTGGFAKWRTQRDEASLLIYP